MAAENGYPNSGSGSSNFVRIFIPGLIVGLLIGLAVGAVIGPLLFH